jgi:hypothetical protein
MPEVVMRRIGRSAAGLFALALIVGVVAPTSDAGVSRPDAGASASIPYTLPVALPSPRTSPPVSADAPYTPTVINLISQTGVEQPAHGGRIGQRQRSVPRGHAVDV